MRRRTKIIATIGPASDSEATLVALVEAGMDVARIGLAHGDLDHHLECYDRIRKASVEADRPANPIITHLDKGVPAHPKQCRHPA